MSSILTAKDKLGNSPTKLKEKSPSPMLKKVNKKLKSKLKKSNKKPKIKKSIFLKCKTVDPRKTQQKNSENNQIKPIDPIIDEESSIDSESKEDENDEKVRSPSTLLNEE